jgi:hypothetical protein
MSVSSKAKRKPVSSTAKRKVVKTAASKPRLTWAVFKRSLPIVRFGFRLSKPLVKRKARQRVAPALVVVRTVGPLVAEYGPPLAEQFGLIEKPKEKRTAPRVLVGVAIGAGAMYVLSQRSG